MEILEAIVIFLAATWIAEILVGGLILIVFGFAVLCFLFRVAMALLGCSPDDSEKEGQK